LTDELKGLGVKVTCLPEADKSSSGIVTGIRNHLNKYAVDIIHCHGHKEHILGCVAGMIARKRPKVVRTLHGMPEPYNGFAKVRAKFFGCVQEFFMNYLTDRVITVSHDMQERLSHKRWADKIVCIHNGINTDRIRATSSREEVRRSLGILDDDFIIGTACRLVPTKRIDLLIEAFRYVNQEHPKVLLMICGNGPLRTELEVQAKRTGISSRIRFLGHRDDIYDVMSVFDLFVMTSEHEGIPMALLEAMALGLPVVVPLVGGIPEIVPEGNAGTFIREYSRSGVAQALEKAILNLSRKPSPTPTDYGVPGSPEAALLTASVYTSAYGNEGRSE
jgi:glycosyltransferase involved in cell wall biosynthesis